MIEDMMKMVHLIPIQVMMMIYSSVPLKILGMYLEYLIFLVIYQVLIMKQLVLGISLSVFTFFYQKIFMKMLYNKQICMQIKHEQVNTILDLGYLFVLKNDWLLLVF